MKKLILFSSLVISAEAYAVNEAVGVSPTGVISQDQIIAEGRQILDITEAEKQLRSAQLLDPDMNSILEVLEQGGDRIMQEEVEDRSPVFRRYWFQWDRLTVYNGVLCRKWYNPGDHVTLQFIVPSSLKASILQGLHDDRVAGHMGITRTFKRVQERYYWCGYHKDVEDWCRKCTVCQARIPPGKSPIAPLKKMRTGARFQCASLDLLDLKINLTPFDPEDVNEEHKFNRLKHSIPRSAIHNDRKVLFTATPISFPMSCKSPFSKNLFSRNIDLIRHYLNDSVLNKIDTV